MNESSFHGNHPVWKPILMIAGVLIGCVFAMLSIATRTDEPVTSAQSALPSWLTAGEQSSSEADVPEVLAEATIPAALTSESIVEPQSMPSRSFMRQKLGSVSKLVEGLSTNNFNLVVDGTDELLHLAEEASWRIPRDPYYMHYSRDFKTTVRGLQDAAKRRNIEEATFAYNHAMVSCMACHRHVRGATTISMR